MQIVHFSDLHIGVENYGRLDPSTGLSTRMGDFLSALDELVEYCLDNEVDLVLFAGDAFKSREPKQTQQREFAKRIARLANAGVQVFLLVGNHDLPYALAQATAVEIYHTLEIENVTVADRVGTWRINTKSGPVQVVGLPWPRRSVLLTRDMIRNLTFDQINDRLQRLLTDLLRKEADALDPSVPAVLTAHVTVAQATVGSERSMMIGNDHVLLLSNVALPQFEYVGLGHIHKTQVLTESPPVVYSGSMQRVDFSEEKDPKGFYVIDVDAALPQGKRVTDYRFQPIQARPFLTIDVDIPPDDPDPTSTIVRRVQDSAVADAVVRLRIKVAAELEPMIIDSEIKKALASAHFVASIGREVDRTRTFRLEGQAIDGMTSLDALKAYLEASAEGRGWSKSQVGEMLALGEELIRESEESKS